MSDLTVRNLTVKYQTKPNVTFTALSPTNLTVNDGEFVTIIGPSGCGKSTLLHAMGGLIAPTSGDISYDGEPLLRPDPRKASYVFQDYSLFPWKTVLDNVSVGLQFAKTPKAEARRRAYEQLKFVGLEQFTAAYPAALSGGMQQRVAIARAIAMDPNVVLMDEPFGALDEQSRRVLGHEMSKLLFERNSSVAMVTHSLDEAIYWADRILVMSNHPGTIIEEIKVSEPRPRSLEFMTSREFQEIRVHLFDLIQAPWKTVAESSSES